MDLLPLLGVLIVTVGFALKFDAILIVMVTLIMTASTGGLSLTSMLETLGTTFMNNRGMATSIIIILATGTLERNGLRESAITLVKRSKKVSAGMIIDTYDIFRIIFAAFNVSFDGIIDFMRPIILPMALGTIKSKNSPMVPEYEEELKGTAPATGNVCWFFGQVLSVGGAGTLLARLTLKDLDYEVTLGELALVEVPVALVTLISVSIYFTLKEKRLRKRYYEQEGLK